MKSNRDNLFGMTLGQKVVQLLDLRRGQWCCDRCLSLALDRPEQHGVQFVTDTLAANGVYRRSRGFCGDCHRDKLVTMANRTAEPTRRGGGAAGGVYSLGGGPPSKM
jgi:hypothetical protein